MTLIATPSNLAAVRERDLETAGRYHKRSTGTTGFGGACNCRAYHARYAARRA